MGVIKGDPGCVDYMYIHMYICIAHDVKFQLAIDAAQARSPRSQLQLALTADGSNPFVFTGSMACSWLRVVHGVVLTESPHSAIALKNLKQAYWSFHESQLLSCPPRAVGTTDALTHVLNPNPQVAEEPANLERHVPESCGVRGLESCWASSVMSNCREVIVGFHLLKAPPTGVCVVLMEPRQPSFSHCRILGSNEQSTPETEEKHEIS